MYEVVFCHKIKFSRACLGQISINHKRKQFKISSWKNLGYQFTSLDRKNFRNCVNSFKGALKFTEFKDNYFMAFKSTKLLPKIHKMF